MLNLGPRHSIRGASSTWSFITWLTRGYIRSSGRQATPGRPAAELLRCLGIEPAAEGNREIPLGTQRHLAEIRAAMFGEE